MYYLFFINNYLLLYACHLRLLCDAWVPMTRRKQPWQGMQQTGNVSRKPLKLWRQARIADTPWECFHWASHACPASPQPLAASSFVPWVPDPTCSISQADSCSVICPSFDSAVTQPGLSNDCETTAALYNACAALLPLQLTECELLWGGLLWKTVGQQAYTRHMSDADLFCIVSYAQRRRRRNLPSWVGVSLHDDSLYLGHTTVITCGHHRGSHLSNPQSNRLALCSHQDHLLRSNHNLSR